MTLIRSISGLRATIGDSLTPEIVADYSSAFSAIIPHGNIIIGRDGRPSGVWIENIVEGTLKACGRNIIKIGIAPTPTVQLLTEHSDAAGGIAITASHNPKEWNGLKFINSNGVFLDENENQLLWNALDNGQFFFSNEYMNFPEPEKENALKKHIESVTNLQLFKKTNIKEAIKQKKFRVVVDAVNSSGSLYVPQLLKEFGCEIIELYCRNDGIFPHTPEPVPENLGDLSKAVINHKADIGIAVDPDADRLVLIDENGKPIGEEKTIVLSVMSVLRNKKYFEGCENKVVVNYSTTRLVEDVAEKFNASVERSPVGEINVVKKMKKCGAVIGGEGSGGVILPASHYGRDSLVGISLVLSLLAESNKKMSEIIDELPKYEMQKFKKEFSGDIRILLEKLLKKFPDSKPTLDDGLKIEFEKSWVQLRKSNTEPIVRVISEAPTKVEAEFLAGEFLKEI